MSTFTMPKSAFVVLIRRKTPLSLYNALPRFGRHLDKLTQQIFREHLLRIIREMIIWTFIRHCAVGRENPVHIVPGIGIAQEELFLDPLQSRRIS